VSTQVICHPMRQRYFTLLCRCVHLILFIPIYLSSIAVHVSADEPAVPADDDTVASLATPLPTPEPQEPVQFFQQVSPIADGFRSLDGLAVDKESGNIYVTEEDVASIICIQPDGSKEVLLDSSTPVYEGKGFSRKRVAGLRSPEGLALDRDGNLYVVEDLPGGRVLTFNIQIEKGRTRRSGKIVPVPIQNSGIAWESIDIGPEGELLLAGSTVEAFPRDMGKEGIFRGVVLYRDTAGEWWMPMNDAMTSYSAGSFTPDGKVAYFACELTGDVGCLDLQSHTLRTYHADRIFKSPEGLCALPDQSVLVAEEGGKIYRLDPIADRIQMVYDNGKTIESVQWDPVAHRLLVTDDQQGILWGLKLKKGLDYGLAKKSIRNILFKAQATPLEMIPDHCPSYLSRVLRLGGYDPDGKDPDIAFQDFARQYSLVSIDADAMLLSSAKPVDDPIKRIQFVIVAPYMMGIQSGQLLWSSSVFAAVKESGEMLKTELVPRQILGGDLLERSCTPIGGETVTVPMPISARVNAEGIASVNFMGMGVTPDFYLILNTVEPNDSYLVIIEAGSVQQYALHLPPYNDSSHWVIALMRTEPDVWKALSFEP